MDHHPSFIPTSYTHTRSSTEKTAAPPPVGTEGYLDVALPSDKELNAAISFAHIDDRSGSLSVESGSSVGSPPSVQVISYFSSLHRIISHQFYAGL